MQKVQVVILAAGKGTRMKNELPKVLIPVAGKPMVERLVDTVTASGLTDKPVVVVSEQNGQQIKSALGDRCVYVTQASQLGTGHAVFCAKDFLQGRYESILVLNGDHPFVTTKMLQGLVDTFNRDKKIFTMTTTSVPDFEGWHKTLFDFGRIIRNGKGQIIEIVEKKDATPQQLEIKELNTSYFCFDANWLWQELPSIKNTNKQAEYYLTDLVKLAMGQGKEVSSFSIEPREAMGINSPEQLLFAQTFEKINN